MTDIVTRLRQSYHLADVQPDHILRRAADEIEKLRAERESLIEDRSYAERRGLELADTVNAMRAERDEALRVVRDMLTFIERDIPPEHARHAEPEMRAARVLLAKWRTV